MEFCLLFVLLCNKKKIDKVSNPVTAYIYAKGTDTKETCVIIMKGDTVIYNGMKIHMDKF